MPTFRMDETNFAEGARAGTRILTGAGLKADFSEFAADSNTLGLWHLHNGACQGEGTGLEDASGAGRNLVNHGAVAVEDGYRFVHSEADYMTAVIGTRSAQSAVTLECWVGQWQSPLDSLRLVARYYRDWNNYLGIQARRSTSPANSTIRIWEQAGGTTVAQVWWTGAAADAIIASSAPWQVAAVLDAGGLLRLFVNGTLRGEASGTQSLPSGDYLLDLGSDSSGLALSAVLDEVRLSSSARYSANFSAQRLLASGTYSSPTFDGVRTQADWADLVGVQTVPPETALGWEVRAADETDVNGEPQALWQPYDGDPSSLPDGRYFQWRSTLSTSADRLTSPTLESVETQASEAGYNLYGATGAGPEALDYSQPSARVGPGVTQFLAQALQTDAVHWFGIRPADERGIESPLTQNELRLELDAQGRRVADRPAGALTLAARPLPDGAAGLEWRWRAGQNGVVPQVFRIFGDGGTGIINYAAPLGEVSYSDGINTYAWTSGPLGGGAQHQLAVRAIAAGGVWDDQPAVATVTPDDSAPGSVDALEAEAIL